MRLTMSLVALAGLLTGCLTPGGGGYLKGDLSCEFNPYDWFGGLTNYVNEGTAVGDEISWDIEGREPWVDAYVGTYNTATGDFSYHSEFNAQHYMVSSTSEGYGTVYDNGDLDVLIDTTSEDIAGVVDTTHVRHERTGCDGSLRFSDPSDSSFESYERTYEITSENTVVLNIDHTFSDGTVYQDEYTAYRNLGIDGQTTQLAGGVNYFTRYQADEQVFVSDWTQTGGEYDYVGNTERDRLTGALDQSYTISQGGQNIGTIAYSVDYLGAGTGTATYSDGTSCNIVFGADGSCDMTCSDGNSYDCS